MNLSTFIKITAKGSDEIKNRTHRFGVKRRSILILLNSPRTVQQILQASVYPREEVVNELHALIHEGFALEDQNHVAAPADATEAVRDYLSKASERLQDFDATRNVIR